MSATRPLPQLNSENRFFWTSGADGKLRFLQCRACATFVHPPRPLCPRCLSEDVSPSVVRGTGRIESFTVNHQRWTPDMEVPFVIARVRIDGAPGVILTSNLLDCEPSKLRLDDAVQVEFEQVEDVYLPKFRKMQ